MFGADRLRIRNGTCLIFENLGESTIGSEIEVLHDMMSWMKM